MAPQGPLSRRTFLQTSGLVAVGATAAACARGGGGDTPTPGGGGTLVVGSGTDIYTLEPPAEASVAVWRPNASVFETLAAATPDLTVAPLLATSWELRPPDTWRIQLRKDVKFHNGTFFNAEAVVRYFNKVLAESGWVPGVTPDSAKAVDEYTVDVVTDPVNYRLIRYLTQPQVPVTAPGTYAGSGSNEKNTPTGTGPFTFVSYAQGKDLTVQRFGGYWGERPDIKKMVFRFLPDGNSRVLALKAGEVDAIYDVPRQQIRELEENPKIQVARSRVGAYQALMVSKNGKPPFDILNDEAVRRAVAYAINQPAIVENVWQGSAKVQPSIIPPKILYPFADKVTGYPYDPDKAAQLLSGAGWEPGPGGIRRKDGRRLELKLTAYLPDEQRPLPELVKAQLKKVGIAVNVALPPDPSTYYDTMAAGEADLFSEGSGSAVEHPYGLTDNLGQDPEESSPYELFAPGEKYGYDEVLRKARAARTERKFDRFTAEMLHIAVDEAVTVIPIAGIRRVYGLSPQVQGFEPHYYVSNQQWDMVSLR